MYMLYVYYAIMLWVQNTARIFEQFHELFIGRVRAENRRHHD